jgi:PAS domain S-box-containing protein
MTDSKSRNVWFWVIVTLMVVFIIKAGHWAIETQNHIKTVNFERDKQTRRAERIVLSAPVPLIMCSHNGKVTLTNPAAEKMFGYTHEQLLGGTIYKLIPPELTYAHATAFRMAAKRAQALDEPRYAMYKEGVESVGVHSDGSRIPILLTICVIKYGNEIEFIAIIKKRDPDAPPPEPELPAGIKLPPIEERIEERIEATQEAPPASE